MKKIEATDEMIKKVMDNTSLVLKSLDMKEDIRKTIPLLTEVTTKLRAISNIYETSENIFVSFLVWSIIAYIRDFEGHPDEWYKLNEDAIDKLRGLMKTLFGNIKNGLEKRDAELIIENIKDWIPEFFKLYEAVTRITK